MLSRPTSRAIEDATIITAMPRRRQLRRYGWSSGVDAPMPPLTIQYRRPRHADAAMIPRHVEKRAGRANAAGTAHAAGHEAHARRHTMADTAAAHAEDFPHGSGCSSFLFSPRRQYGRDGMGRRRRARPLAAHDFRAVDGEDIGRRRHGR